MFDKKAMKTINKILLIVGIFLICFIGVMCFFFYKFQEIPETLVTCVLGTGTAELLASAGITVVRKIFGGKDE